MEFVAGNHERRRWFFDQVLSLYDPVYLDDLRRYRRALKTRNSVLRDAAAHKLNGNPGPILDALDEQCAQYGIRLMEKRETAGKLFTGVFMQLYAEVAGVSGMSVLYSPSWKNVPDLATVITLLHSRRDADMAVGISLSGPHRDRYTFVVSGTEFTGNASTGQRRLLALLLRVAQASRFSETTGRNPILLFDDVLLEIAGEKRRRFLAALPIHDQAFFTFLPEEPYQLYKAGTGNTLVYSVKCGQVTAQ
jgi:DNA replication and repair protein RecF